MPNLRWGESIVAGRTKVSTFRHRGRCNNSLLAGSNAAGDVLGFSNSATRFSSFINSSNTSSALVSPPLTVPSATIPNSSILGTAKSPLGPLKLS